MNRISIGDASLTSILQRQGATLKADMQRASTEVVTGRQTDTAAAVRGDLTTLAALDASLGRLAAYRSTAADAGFLSGAMQTTLATLTNVAGPAATSLLRAASMTTPSQVNIAAAEARARLDTALGAINTQVAGRSVLSGVETGIAPLGTAAELLTALETAVIGATTSDAIETAVRGWFADPVGYGAFYRGGAAQAPLPIAAGESADLAVTAQDPAFKDTLAGLAMAALLDRGLMNSQPSARVDLANRAGLMLQNSEDARVGLAARIGIVEAQIETASSRNAAEDSALKIARSGIAAVDPYEAASRLEELQAALEALYLVTSRVSRLNLAEYIR